MPAARKTHTTAVVLIPPADCWPPIQEIRRRHDRNLRRWMPHITLLYPFRPRNQFDGLERPLQEACRRVAAFEVRLARFRHFAHGRGRFTVWLEPEPPARVVELQAALQGAVPDCDDVSSFRTGFTPHLSVGQVHGKHRLVEVTRQLQAEWRRLPFTADRVSLIWRCEPPDDVFRIDREVTLLG